MPTVEVNDASIYYEVHGEGPAIVLVHGAGGNTLVWWQQVPFFARDHQVITFDHRGFGRSVCKAGEEKARFFPGDLEAVMDHAEVGRAALICQSMGGATGMHFALENPRRVKCMVLSDTSARIQTPQVIENTAGRAQSSLPSVGSVTAWNEPPRALAADAASRDPDRSFLYARMSSLNPEGAASRIDGDSMNIDPDRLAGYEVPTLVVCGENDRLYAPAVLEEVAQVIPGAQFHVIPVAGHSPYFETPEAFNRVVGEFIDKHLE